MNIKQLFLSVVTLLAIVVLGYSLVSSWQEPQVQSQIELYQTDLVLQAAEWQKLQASDPDADSEANAAVWASVFGQDPLNSSLKRYREAAAETETNLTRLRSPAAESGDALGKVISPSAQKTIQQLEKNQTQLKLKLGVLEAQQGQPDTALKLWQPLVSRSEQPTVAATAETLVGLWSKPPQILPGAEQQIQTGLNGWFRYHALSQLYRVQQRFDALAQLQNQTQLDFQVALQKLLFVGVMPTLGIVVGSVLFIGLVVQRLRKGSAAWLAQPKENPWVIPWNGEIVWQVLILTFFVLGQIAIPVVFSILGWRASAGNPRSFGFLVLGNYLVFSLTSLFVLWASIRSFLPLSKAWFHVRLRWNAIWSGIGGYLVAVPLVVIVSLVNQQLWQGRGGSNPLLPVALNGQDQVALLCFFITAAVAAPIFEEIMFRGFLLPSLTRYLPMSGAIVASSFIFAIAHLSLSEVLPLSVLGMILGVVYTRTQNLLAPMLLHSLWNSGTLLTLFVLGSSSSTP